MCNRSGHPGLGYVVFLLAGVAMSDHLPECPHVEGGEWTEQGWVQYACICDRLRACEARVREEYAMEWQSEQEEIHILGLNLAYSKALDAARDAVAALPYMDIRYNGGLLDALAAIDALREDK